LAGLEEEIREYQGGVKGANGCPASRPVEKLPEKEERGPVGKITIGAE
jgi:hypothetical protein